MKAVVIEATKQFNSHKSEEKQATHYMIHGDYIAIYHVGISVVHYMIFDRFGGPYELSDCNKKGRFTINSTKPGFINDLLEIVDTSEVNQGALNMIFIMQAEMIQAMNGEITACEFNRMIKPMRETVNHKQIAIAEKEVLSKFTINKKDSLC